MEIRKNEKTAANTVELLIFVGPDEFAPAMEKSYRKNVKRLNIPGFRKGKAPRKMIEKVYGEAVFYDDAIQYTYPLAYGQAIEETGLDPVDQPDIEITDIDGSGYEFLAKITVKPEIKVGEYKGLQAEKVTAAVSEEEILQEIERLRTRVSRMQQVERPIGTGDTAVIDFEGSVDGVPFEGGKGEKFSLAIGSGQFIPGFEEQLVGAKAGDPVDVKVTFPEEYHAKELAGKEALFKCLIHEVSETVKPEVNDEFAKDVSEFDTIAELKDDIRAKILESKQKSEDNAFEEKLIDQIINSIEGEIPQVMYENQIDKNVEEFSQRMTMQGLNMQTYMQMNGMNDDSFRKLFAEQAERQVKIRLALEVISKLENITASDEEIEKEYEVIAEKSGMAVDKVKEYVKPDTIRADLVLNHTIDLIRDSAVPEKEAKEEEADSEKKAPAKKTANKAVKKDEDESAE